LFLPEHVEIKAVEFYSHSPSINVKALNIEWEEHSTARQGSWKKVKYQHIDQKAKSDNRLVQDVIHEYEETPAGMIVAQPDRPVRPRGSSRTEPKHSWIWTKLFEFRRRFGMPFLECSGSGKPQVAADGPCGGYYTDRFGYDWLECEGTVPRSIADIGLRTAPSVLAGCKSVNSWPAPMSTEFGDQMDMYFGSETGCEQHFAVHREPMEFWRQWTEFRKLMGPTVATLEDMVSCI
jgi:hypothetical protein